MLLAGPRTKICFRLRSFGACVELASRCVEAKMANGVRRGVSRSRTHLREWANAVASVAARTRHGEAMQGEAKTEDKGADGHDQRQLKSRSAAGIAPREVVVGEGAEAEGVRM